MIKVNLGCGRDVRENYVNVDKHKFKGVNIIHNLDKFPYPFKDDTFDEIMCNYVFEHLTYPEEVLKEMCRIGKNGVKIKLIVPFWNGMYTWADIQHKRGFTLYTFDGNDRECFKGQKFELIKQKLIGTKLTNWMPQRALRVLSYFLCNIAVLIEVELEVRK